MHLGCSIGPAVGRLCQSPSADGVGRYSGGIIVGEARPSAWGKTGRPMMGLPSGDEDGHVGSSEQTLSHF